MRLLSSMLTLVAATIFVPLQAAPAPTTDVLDEHANSTSATDRRTNLGDCYDYNPMSLGRLIFHNRAAIVGAMCVKYVDDPYSSPWRIPGSGGSDWPRVLAGANHQYDYDDQMLAIDRDRPFNLFVCDLVGTSHDWGQLNGQFEIFSSGPLWTAEVTFTSDNYADRKDDGSYRSPQCTVTDQIR